MSNTKPFTNPYRSFEGTALRLNLNAPLTDVQTIRSVLMEQGSLQTTWALFLKHLADYVRTNNYTIADREQLIDHIIARCTESGTDGNANRRHVGRAVKGVR